MFYSNKYKAMTELVIKQENNRCFWDVGIGYIQRYTGVMGMV